MEARVVIALRRALLYLTENKVRSDSLVARIVETWNGINVGGDRTG